MSLPTLRSSLLGIGSLASAVPVLAQPAQVVQPAPVVVQPAPVVVQPAPVVVQPGPVVVQPAPEEIVIVGRYGVPDNVDSLSMTVGYADLDLSYPGDRKILRQRIALTARFLCDKLGESDTGAGSCRDEASRDALRRVGTIEAHFAPRGTAWVRPQPWAPPYPVGWVEQYP